MTDRKNSLGKRVFKGAAIGVVLLVGLSACSGMNTGPDQAGLHYSGGPLSSTEFLNCVDPGSREVDGPFDAHFAYPFGQRTFDFTGNEGSDSGGITVVSNDEVTMTVPGIATFALNTNCDTLRQFHERIGLKYQSWTEDGWTRTLNTYVKQPLDKALDAASKQYGYKELYTDPEVKEKWEEEVARLAAIYVKDQAGALFFCNPNYTGTGDCGQFSLTIQAPQPPQTVRDALSAQQEAVAQGEAAVARAKAEGDAAVAQAEAEQRTAIAEAETLRIQNESLAVAMRALGLVGPEGLKVYSTYLIAKDGSIPFIDLPDGAIIDLSTLPTE